MSWIKRITGAHILCSLMILAGIVAYGVTTGVDILSAWKQSVDDAGRITNAVQWGLIAFGVFAASSFAGLRFRAGHWIVGSVCFALAVGFTCYSMSNSIGFMYAQTVGKMRLVAAKNAQAKDIAELQNKATLEERKADREWRQRTYENTKSTLEKRRLEKGMTGQTIAPLVEARIEDVMPDGKAAFFARWLKIDPETFRMGDSTVVVLLVALIKLCFPTLGFAYWPRGSREGDEEEAKPDKPSSPPEELPQPMRPVDQNQAASLVRSWLASGDVESADPKAHVSGAEEVYGWFRDWCQHGHHLGRVPTQTRFGMVMSEIGIPKEKRGRNVVYRGLRRKVASALTRPAVVVRLRENAA